MAKKRRKMPPRTKAGRFRKRRRAPARSKRRRRRRNAPANPPRRRSRRSRRRNMPVANAPRRRGRSRSRPAKRRGYRRNPPRTPWMGIALTAGLITVGEGLLRSFVAMPLLRNWAPLAIKAGLAWFWNRKAKTKPLAIVAGTLAVADLAALATTWFLPAAAAPTPPTESQGFVRLPPGIAGPTGFPTGAQYPSYAGLPQRMDNSITADAYGYFLADSAGLSLESVM